MLLQLKMPQFFMDSDKTFKVIVDVLAPKTHSSEFPYWSSKVGSSCGLPLYGNGRKIGPLLYANTQSTNKTNVAKLDLFYFLFIIQHK